MSNNEAPEDRLLNQRIDGKYHLIRIQARGAFGTVFIAHQYFGKQFVRPVAVKVSRQTGLDEETTPYLFGDAVVLARLLAANDHEGRRHLVQIFDMGLLPEHDNRAFLVMEYVDGLPLLSHLRAAGTFSVASGIRFVKQICQALALVHGNGAVHRDLKSDNILVDRRGTIRVIDFGLAAFTNPALGFTPGALGTFTYMAPETLLGRSTPASDVYSLGLLLHELFTGGGPHLTAPWSIDHKKDYREEHYRLKVSLSFPKPSEFHNEIRNDYRWIDGLIARCLDAEPEFRFADAGEVLSAIEHCEKGEELPFIERRKTVAEAASPSPSAVLKATAQSAEELKALLREARKHLAGRAYDRVIDRLDVFRPPEWAVLDLASARILRLLGQAYLGHADFGEAKDCLEQVRTAQKEQPLLQRHDYAAVLSDLVKCYRGLAQAELAEERQREAREI